MEKVFYLLYEGDCWLSNHSLVCFGVFTSDSNLMEGVRKLVRQRISNYKEENETEEEVVERVCEEFCNYNMQTQRYEVNLLAREITPNKIEEL